MRKSFRGSPWGKPTPNLTAELPAVDALTKLVERERPMNPIGRAILRRAAYYLLYGARLDRAGESTKEFDNANT